MRGSLLYGKREKLIRSRPPGKRLSQKEFNQGLVETLARLRDSAKQDNSDLGDLHCLNKRVSQIIIDLVGSRDTQIYCYTLEVVHGTTGARLDKDWEQLTAEERIFALEQTYERISQLINAR